MIYKNKIHDKRHIMTIKYLFYLLIDFKSDLSPIFGQLKRLMFFCNTCNKFKIMTPNLISKLNKALLGNNAHPSKLLPSNFLLLLFITR